jgi:hypothetical protein
MVVPPPILGGDDSASSGGGELGAKAKSPGTESSMRPGLTADSGFIEVPGQSSGATASGNVDDLETQPATVDGEANCSTKVYSRETLLELGEKPICHRLPTFLSPSFVV